MRVLFLLVPFVATLAIHSHAGAQTRSNPQISLVGDFRAFTHNDPARAAESEKFNFSDPGAELFIAGHLNPYVSAAATFAWHSDAGAEVEELYATVHRGLPLRAGLQVGQYRLGFGRLNL